MESQSLERTITDDQRIALALAISQADGNLPQKLPALANQLGVDVGSLVDLLNDRAFIKLMRDINKAQATLTFGSVVMPRLVKIAKNGEDKHALAAGQMIGRVSGDLTPHKIVDMRVTFDDLRKRSAGDADPLANLFEIRGDVIEAEIKEEATDDYEEWEAEQ